jgi:hypothetical protein
MRAYRREEQKKLDKDIKTPQQLDVQTSPLSMQRENTLSLR